jgi:hypothetical protein
LQRQGKFSFERHNVSGKSFVNATAAARGDFATPWPKGHASQAGDRVRAGAYPSPAAVHAAEGDMAD